MKDIDQHIRQILLEGTESVSPSAWKAVKAGIAPVGKTVVPASVWLWRSLAGVAVAAAVAVGVFVFHPFGNSNQNINSEAALAVSEAEISAPETLQEDQILPIQEQISGSENAVAQNRPVVKHIKTQPVKTVRVKDGGTLDTVSPGEGEKASVVSEEEKAEEKAASMQKEEEAPVKCTPVVSSEPAPKDFEEELRQAYPEKDKSRIKKASVSVGGHLFGARGTGSDNQVMMMAAPSTASTLKEGITEQYPEYSFGIPASLGIGFRYDISPKLSVGTGVFYSGLKRSFVGSYKENGTVVAKDADIDNLQHFVGVPVDLFFNFLNDNRLKVYAFAGGAAEKLLANNYVIPDKDITYKAGGADGFQFSVAAGIGIEYLFTDYLGLYLDPSLRYYFDCGQPRSIRTIQPFMLNFEAGLKFHFGGAR